MKEIERICAGRREEEIASNAPFAYALIVIFALTGRGEGFFTSNAPLFQIINGQL